MINAAGTAGAERRVLTEDGNEQTFQVNYLAHYQLTRLLEGPLSKPAAGRVVNLTSTLHRGGSINWADPTRGRRYTRHAAYAQATLAIAMCTATLAESWPNGMTAVSVDPGTSDRAVLRLHGPWVQPNPAAAAIVTNLGALDTAVINGGFYDQLLPAETAAHVSDPRALRRLWTLSERLTGLG